MRSINIENDNVDREFKNQKLNTHSLPVPVNHKIYGRKQDLSTKPKLPNMDMRDFIGSELPQIDNQDKDKLTIRLTNLDTISVLEDSMRERRETSKKYLTPKFPEIALNGGNNLKEQSPPHVSPSSLTKTLQYVELREDENCNFMRDAQSPRSGSPVGSPGNSAQSVYHDALGDRGKCWKQTGESPLGAGLGITLGQKHDESTKRLQHDMLARAEESSVKLQKVLGECQKKSGMVDEQKATENQREWTEWGVSKERHYKEEFQRITDEHVSELNMQKETVQKAINIEIIREKAQLVQEFDSRISQEVTEACKIKELRINQLNRSNRNLREEKQGQEMDMEAYREKIACQEEDLLKANKRILELMHNLDERNQEVERLHVKIGGLEKKWTEAQLHNKQMAKELQKSKRELEASKMKADYSLDSTSDAETASGSGSSMRHWVSDRRTSKSKIQELKLKNVSEQLAEGKAVIESQSCQINLLKEEVLNLAEAHEEDDTIIKVQRRKIHSLESLPQRLFALSESFDNLKDEFHNLSRIEEQGKATIKQLQNEIDEFVATRVELKEAHKSLIVKETDLNETMAKLQHGEAVIKQQQKEIDEFMITRIKLKEIHESLMAKETDLNETMIKLQHDEAVIKQQRTEIDDVLLVRAKLGEVQDSLDVKEIDLNETGIKLECDEAIIKQQQGEINQLVITRAKLKELQKISKFQKFRDLDKTMIELEQAKQELQNLRRAKQGKADATLEDPFKSNRERPSLADSSINSEQNAGAGSSFVDKQSPLPNVGGSVHPLVILNTNNNNNNNGSTSPPREIGLFGAEDISEEIEEEDYYDDGHESLHSLLERAVAGGEAILRKLKMRPGGL